MMRELRVEDALMYLDQVKMEFGDRPHIYNEFLDIMKTFKSQAIDTPGVIRRVASLFHGNRRLVLGFNTFLPEGYRIELPLDGSEFPVYREPGRSGVTQIRMLPQPTPYDAAPGGGAAAAAAANQATAGGAGPPPGSAQPGSRAPPGAMGRGGQPGVGRGSAAAGRGPPPPSSAGRGQKPGSAPPLRAPPPGPGAPVSMLLQPQPGADADKQPVEFDHAINYVTTIKKRFAAHPEIYRKFLEILHTYQKEQRGIKEVLDEVSSLFADHADLLKEFTYFLPDAVQAQAKAQLDVAAKKAEERCAARERSRRQLEASKQQQSKAAPPPAPSSSAVAPPPQQPAAPPGTPYGKGREARISLPAPPPPTPTRDAAPAQPRVPGDKPVQPFGATKARSADRELEIAASAKHGHVSFGPHRPPRRNELTPSQRAQLLGRPRSVPGAACAPTVAEQVFFDRVRAHFDRRDLFPEQRAVAARKHTPYSEFVKCLHLFGVGVIGKDELISLLKGLFIHGNVPRGGSSSSSAGGGSSGAAQAANHLLADLEKVLVGRGPFANQEAAKRLKGKHSLPLREESLGSSAKPVTVNYTTYPSDYVPPKCSGKTEHERKNLNGKCFSMPRDYPTRGERHYASPELYDGVKDRRNAYEEVMCRVEDEMAEVDMAIERNASAMRALRPIRDEAVSLAEQEERDGMPIGRLQYKLKLGSLNSVHIGAIARVYGESGDEVIQHLRLNPIAVVPIVYSRLKEKDAEWRKVKKDLNRGWKAALTDNHEGSFDVKCVSYKREIEKSFSEDRLIEECQRAKSFAKNPSKIPQHPATTMMLPNFHLVNATNPILGLFQPHLSVLESANMPHKDAFGLLETYINKVGPKKMKEAVSSFRSAFVEPWFGLPASTPPERPTVKYTPGQKVRTTVGDGQVVSVSDDAGGETPFRYLVRFGFGTGYVWPDAIAHVLPPNVATVPDGPSGEDGAPPPGSLMPEDVQVLFGTESVYLFMRLYILLVTMLYQAKDIIGRDSANVARRIADPERGDVYESLLSIIRDAIEGKIDEKELETRCRNLVKRDVYNFVAIPPLVDGCGDAALGVLEEDLYMNLYHCSQLKLKGIKQTRLLSLEVTDEAVYRMQIQGSASQVFFSYLPPEMELVTTNPRAETAKPPPAESRPAPMDTDEKAADPASENGGNAAASEKPAEGTVAAKEPDLKRPKTGVDAEGKSP